jgi:hypothetical protein
MFRQELLLAVNLVVFLFYLSALRFIVDANKEVDLEVKSEKAKYTLLSRHQNARQNYDIKIANRCFENVTQLKYFGTRVTYQNFVRKETEKTLNSGNACYHSVQNLLSSHLLPKNLKN